MPNNVNVRVGTSGVGKASSELDHLRDKFDKLQKQGAKGFAIGAGAAITTAGINAVTSALSGAGDLMADAIDKASNLNETMSKSGAVFGDNADEVSSWGNSTADAFGLSKQAAIEAAATFGDLFNKVGIGADKSVQMSQSLVGLSADLASFNNLAGGSAEALEKIRSGLAGETEPLRSLGVFLNEAKVKAKAMELGLVGANGALSEGAKIQARYALILEETASAQGDFARTSDQLANTQRRNQAKLDDALARFGNTILPGVTDAALVASNVLDGLAKATDDLGKEWETNGPLALIFNDRTNEVTKGQGTLKDALAASGKTLADFAPAADEASSAADGTARSFADTTEEAADLAEALEDLTDAAYDATSAFGDQAFSADELKGRIGELANQLKEAKDELRELEAIKDPTAAQQRDIDIARGKVSGYRHDIFDARVELAKLDGTGLDALLDELRKAATRTDALGDAARDALHNFRQLGKIGMNPLQSWGGGRASGGPVKANEAYLVGEEGPELFVPGASGNIIPNGGSGGGSSSGGTSWGGATINLSPTVVIQGVATPASMAAIQAELMPTIIDGLRRAGVI